MPSGSSNVDLIFEETKSTNEQKGKNSGTKPIVDQIETFKSRVYGIIHGGYNLLRDSKANPEGTEIDGRVVKSRAVFSK